MKKSFSVLFTAAVPFCLFLTVWQASRYGNVEREINDYNKEQYRIIEENKRKISAISILSRPARIEKIADEELKMRKALSSEIFRIELIKEKQGG